MARTGVEARRSLARTIRARVRVCTHSRTRALGPGVMFKVQTADRTDHLAKRCDGDLMMLTDEG